MKSGIEWFKELNVPFDGDITIKDIISIQTDAQADLIKASDEYRIQLDAWQYAFRTSQLSHAVAERDHLIKAIKVCCEALESAHSSLDKLMGDSDLDSDESHEMRSCQKICHALTLAHTTLKEVGG